MFMLHYYYIVKDIYNTVHLQKAMIILVYYFIPLWFYIKLE